MAGDSEMDQRRSRPLRVDTAAESADPTLPPFLSRPSGVPAYYGFPVVPETDIDGWFYGAITEPCDPDGCDSGDGYVVAPDGSRAGLVWEVGEGITSQIIPPEDGRWGVYAVWFRKPVRTIEDLINNFRAILPELQAIHERISNPDK